MSMAQVRVLMREQRNMLNTFIPAYVLIKSGSAEELETFWESVYAQWFQSWPEHQDAATRDRCCRRIRLFIQMNHLHRTLNKWTVLQTYFSVTKRPSIDSAIVPECLSALMGVWVDGVFIQKEMPQKKWATAEQEEFLMSHLPEFRVLAATKNYKDFLKRIYIEWFQRWPERKAMFPDFPAEHIYMAEEEHAIALGLDTRRMQLATWFRWQINPARLRRSTGARGVLKFDAVLAGGVDLKGTRAPQKLDVYSNMYYEKKVKGVADDAFQKEHITNRGPKLNKHREMTLPEVEGEICETVPTKVDDMSKIKAIRELSPMLDRILKYLGHATGGWKFTVLMGGHDPSTGEVSMFNYHVGELESGAQFDQVCPNFDAVQNSFLEFVKDIIAFEATLPQEAESDEGESPVELDSDSLDLDHMWEKKNFDDLYRMTPQSDRTDLPATSSSCGDQSCDDDVGITDSPCDASTNCNVGATGNASTALVDTSGDASSFGFPFAPDNPDPIFMGNIDFSAFDSQAFFAAINDPNFDISALDSGFSSRDLDTSNAPSQQSFELVHLDTSNTPSQLSLERVHPRLPTPNPIPETLLPPVPETLLPPVLETLLPPVPETLLPPVPPQSNVEIEKRNGESELATRPEGAIGSGRWKRGAGDAKLDKPPVQRAPQLCAHNNVPFNPRERDNEIGVPTRRAARRS
ncbi:hypothetical protein EV424DRAFT_1540467 [Suillus variegatus]|nr:hypothetical protein EV424DRAFT_1540467 [Suillus variegatus]